MVDFRKLFLLIVTVAISVLIASTGLAATTPIETHVSVVAETKTVGADSASRVVADIGATHLRLSSMFSQCVAGDVANSQSTLFYGDVAGNADNRNMAITIAQRHRISVGAVARAQNNRNVVRSVWTINARTARHFLRI